MTLKLMLILFIPQRKTANRYKVFKSKRERCSVFAKNRTLLMSASHQIRHLYEVEEENDERGERKTRS